MVAVASRVIEQVLLVSAVSRPELLGLLDSGCDGIAFVVFDLVPLHCLLNFVTDLQGHFLLVLVVVEDDRPVPLTFVVALLIAGRRVMESEEEAGKVIKRAHSCVVAHVKDFDVARAFQFLELTVLWVSRSIILLTHEANGVTK